MQTKEDNIENQLIQCQSLVPKFNYPKAPEKNKNLRYNDNYYTIIFQK